MERLALIAAALMASPVMAQADTAPRTRVVECGVESCLLIRGRRADATALVSVNGHPVSASGRQYWKARIPVRTVQQWSAPYARTIEVSVGNEQHSARLPVGLLGTRGDLAMLVVSVK